MMPIDTSTEAAFMQRRCKVLDAFAELEFEVALLIAKFGDSKGCAKSPLSQRLQNLDALKPQPLLSKARKREISETIKKIEPLLQVRADIVHSKMRLVTIDGESQGVFRNSADASSAYPLTRLLTQDQLDKLSRTIFDLARELRSKP